MSIPRGDDIFSNIISADAGKGRRIEEEGKGNIMVKVPGGLKEEK